MSNIPVNFTKMHGLGNDFVVMDRITQHFNIDTNVIQKIAHRNRGIGCDQVLILDPPNNPDADFNYLIFNKDGNEVAQCGNGARCIGKFIYNQNFINKNLVTLNTQAGSLKLDLTDPENIKVNLGQPIFAPHKIPIDLNHLTQVESKHQERYQISYLDNNREVSILGLGNPHCIITIPAINEADVNSVGKALQEHPAFISGVNVTFMQVLAKNHIKCRTFERGVGETQACGSGACSAVIAGIMNNELNNSVKVDLPGGSLFVEFTKENEVLLIGPATAVFSGTFCIKEQEIF